MLRVAYANLIEGPTGIVGNVIQRCAGPVRSLRGSRTSQFSASCGATESLTSEIFWNSCGGPLSRWADNKESRWQAERLLTADWSECDRWYRLVTAGG